LKVFHFECYPIEKKYQKKNGHQYFSETFQEYLLENKTLDANIITGFVYSEFNSQNLSKVNDLRLLITRSIGMDHIDMEYCGENNIIFKNIEYPNHNVVHHTFALLLYYSRNFSRCVSKMRKGKFCDNDLTCFDLKSAKLGIIGYGRIGKEVAELAKAFQMNVLVYERKNPQEREENGILFCSMDQVLSESDVISIHCDANPTSIGMINSENIRKMKEGVILLNTARGSLINERDLIINIKKFSFVGLDVLNEERGFNKKNPLLKFPNVFITPHIAYKSEQITKERWSKTYKYIDEFTLKQKS
jgi:D-lactate dehydrogenase